MRAVRQFPYGRDGEYQILTHGIHDDTKNGISAILTELGSHLSAPELSARSCRATTRALLVSAPPSDSLQALYNSNKNDEARVGQQWHRT